MAEDDRMSSETPPSPRVAKTTEAEAPAEPRPKAGDDANDTNAAHTAPVEEAPPLPDEEAPPLPNEAPPGRSDDGWEPVWDATNQAYYFYNRVTQATQWENPRVPDQSSAPPGLGPHDRSAGALGSTVEAPGTSSSAPRVAGGYNPAIHGDYDPTADYAIEAQEAAEEERQRELAAAAATDPNVSYEATGAFNRFTGRWQADALNPDMHNDENKSRRQMNAFFDVDAAANSHDGRSLKAERSGKKLTKAELKAFQEKRRNKKEEKRRAWLRD